MSTKGKSTRSSSWIVNVGLARRRINAVALILLSLMLVMAATRSARALEVYNSDDTRVNIGFWGQSWYQFISDFDIDGDGIWNQSHHDFMFRRAYFYVNASVTPRWQFFVHYAADRLGTDALEGNPGIGLGTGLAFRDGWVRFNAWEDNVIVQAGRMYIPLTRNYGTTSTKSLLTLDLNWSQGGYRGGIFYPSNVGRDDAITLWGNIAEDRLQYRFMVGDGMSGAAPNSADNPRLAGRVSYNLFDAEVGWFNSGTYLGKKHVLAIGAGMDAQNDLVVGGSQLDYYAWTVDAHYDQPIGEGNAVTGQASVTKIDNSPNGLPMTWVAAGDDAVITAMQVGYYFGEKIELGYFQPFAHFENIHERGANGYDTRVYGLGFNFYVDGVANKVSFEATVIDQEQEGAALESPRDEVLLTLQLAAGI